MALRLCFNPGKRDFFVATTARSTSTASTPGFNPGKRDFFVATAVALLLVAVGAGFNPGKRDFFVATKVLEACFKSEE